jgi:hypothetical protein
LVRYGCELRFLNGDQVWTFRDKFGENVVAFFREAEATDVPGNNGEGDCIHGKTRGDAK